MKLQFKHQPFQAEAAAAKLAKAKALKPWK